MAKTHKAVLKELLQDTEFKREYDALEPEFALRRAIQLLRKAEDISQQELAEKLGTKQAYISRVERQPLNLSMAYLARLFDALNADIELRVAPRDGSAPIKVRLVEAQPASVVARTTDVTWLDIRALGIRKAREWKEKARAEQDPFNKYFSLFVGYNIMYNLYAETINEESASDREDSSRAAAAIGLLDRREREELMHTHLSGMLSEYLCTITRFKDEKWKKKDGNTIRTKLREAFQQKDWPITFEMLVKWLYKVRCNLFHGEKGRNDRDQELLLRESSMLLDPILGAFIESYARKHLRQPTD